MPTTDRLGDTEQGDHAAGRGSVESPPGPPHRDKRVRIPSLGSLGYTGTYREPCLDIVDVSVVSVLEARGPE
jgi:hypothetical protein